MSRHLSGKASTPFDEDEITGKAYDARLMKRLLTYGFPYKLQLISAIALLLIISGLELIGPLLTKWAIDVHIANKDIPGLMQVLILYVLVLFGLFFGRFYQIYLTNWVGQR
ncbi:MAG: ABC transporter ATP-binding protein, partial [bacterium]